MTDTPEPLSGFKWPVGVSRVIAAPHNDIWNAISSPGLLPLYHPYCEQNPVLHWPGAGAADVVHYFNGKFFERHITDWFDGEGFNLHFGRPGGRRSHVSWRVAEQGERRTRITITVYPHAVQHLPVVVRWLPHLHTVRPQLTKYLESVVKGLDWFVTMGEPVTRNQFGPHPWFSPATETDPT